MLILLQVPIIVAHIHRNTRLVRASFQIQKNRTLNTALTHRKQKLHEQWYALQDQEDIKQYAEESLRMKQVALSQVKKLERNET